MTVLNDEARNIRRWRIFWAGIIWVLTSVLVIFGAGYAVGGASATSLPGAFAVYIRYLPGDLHTYGGAMLFLAVLLMHGLLPSRGLILDDIWLVRALKVVGGASFFIVWMFAWSWALSGTPTWQGMGYWGGECAIAWLCAFYPPPRPHLGDRPERVDR